MNHTVLITGCSSGIGAAAVQHFAAQGWNVAATLRNPASAHFEDGAGKVATFALDVTDQKSVDAAVAQAAERFGQIDVLINNAGYGLFGPFETATQEVIERQFQTNVFGVFAVTRAVLPHMRERASGVIITWPRSRAWWQCRCTRSMRRPSSPWWVFQSRSATNWGPWAYG